MPYSPEHKAKTRARIIEGARVLFNRHGFEQVSIDDIMRHVGLTRGGFYNHFSSKDELYAEAVQSFVACNPFVRQTSKRDCESASPRKLARMLIDLYLSDAILEDVDQQCPLIALPSDVARAGLKPRAAYTNVVENMARIFRAAFAAGDEAAERKALLIVNLCVGGMILARTTDDPHLKKTLRETAKAEALALLDRATLAEEARALSA
jgi:AcrR family transcriptional regulator